MVPTAAARWTARHPVAALLGRRKAGIGRSSLRTNPFRSRLNMVLPRSAQKARRLVRSLLGPGTASTTSQSGSLHFSSVVVLGTDPGNRLHATRLGPPSHWRCRPSAAVHDRASGRSDRLDDARSRPNAELARHLFALDGHVLIRPCIGKRTGGPDFRSPALRLASPQGTRRCSEWQAFEAQQTDRTAAEPRLTDARPERIHKCQLPYGRLHRSPPPVQFVADSPLEGSGFELPVPQCALSSPTERLWSRPRDLAVSGGALNGHLTTPIGGRPATPRLTRREDRSAQLGRGPEDLGNRAAANYRFPNRLSLICRLSGPLEPSYEV